MNLLDKNSLKGEEGKLYKKMMDVLISAGTEDNNLKLASEFLNFDNEVDFSLLKEIETQKNVRHIASDIAWHSKDIVVKFAEGRTSLDRDYIDRYILVANAIFGSAAGYILWYYLRSDIIDFFIQSLCKYYSKEESIGRIIAMAVNDENYDNGVSLGLSTLLNSNAKSYFNAVNYLNYRYEASEYTIYALGFLNLNSDELEADDELATQVKTACLEIFSEMSKSTPSRNFKKFKFMMTVAFIASKFSKNIEIKLSNMAKDAETGVLVGIFNSIRINGYIDNNIDRLFNVLNLKDSNEKTVKECIAVAARFAFNGATSFSYNKGYYSTFGAEFLQNCTVEFPDEYISLICSESFSQTDICGYFPSLYQILKSQNPEALEKAGISRSEVLKKLSIGIITKLLDVSNGCYLAVRNYLSGKDGISILEPYFDKLNDKLKTYEFAILGRADLIEEAAKADSDFAKKYYVILGLTHASLLANYQNIDHKNTDATIKMLRKYINAFKEEGLPLKYRFKAYEGILEWDELKSFINIFAKEMTGDFEEYKICKKMGVKSRLIYTEYLHKRIKAHINEDACREELFSMFGDASSEVRSHIVEIVAKDKSEENKEKVLNMLSAKKAAARDTALCIIEAWGAENFQDILLEMTEREKTAKIIDKIHSMLAISSSNSNSEEEASPTMIVDNLHKGGRNKKVLWLFETPNSPVHFNNGNLADDRYLQAILLCYSNMTNFCISKEANILAENLNKIELENFALEIFLKWIQENAEAKKKWILYFASIYGGFNMIEIFQKYIKEWSEAARGAIAAEAVMALALNGSSDALMAVDNISHKFKHKQVKSAANQALQNAADILGITKEELGDKIVPNLGFDENMERIFDYGTRKFKVYLNTALELEVYDEKDKKLKTLPAVGAKDTEDIAKASNAEFKQMKKQLKNVVKIQKLRLETAMLADRRWTVDAWESLFVKNPVMHKFAMGLIWIAYEDNKAVQSFRYMEDGTFNTSDEDEYELPKTCTIGLAHPIDLDEETLLAWKEQLSDYEIIQPMEQLEKKVYTVDDTEKGKLDLLRFNDRELNGYTLLNRMTKMGWYKGSVQDAGCFYTFYREDITKRIDMGKGVIKYEGNAVELTFSGMYVAGDDENVSIERVRFYEPGTVERGSYVYDEVDDKKSFKLDEVNPRYFSEIIAQLEVILKTNE